MPKTDAGSTHAQLLAENLALRARLEEAEETLRAIRSGEVDALIVAGPHGDQVFTLTGADQVYRTLIENMSEGALTLTADGVILYANRRFAAMVQTPLAKVIGADFEAWLAPDSRAVLPTLLPNGGEPRRAEVLLTSGRGAPLPVNLSVNRLSTEEPPAVYCMVVTDLTEQREHLAALTASEEKFQYIFDNSVVGKSVTLPSGEINVNKAFGDLLGYTRAELADRTWQEVTHPDDIALTERMLAPLLAGKQDSARFTKRYLHKDGSTIWADVGTALRRDAAGKPLYYVTSVNDITERKQAEENLRQSEALLRLVADNLPAYVAYVSASTLCYQFVNRRYARSFQRPVEEIIGQPITNILSPANFEFAWPYILRALRGESCSYENTFPLAEGKRWLQVNYVPSRDQSGQVTGLVILNYDITERKQAEEALREAEQRFRSMFERHDAIMLLLDPHSGAIVDANNAAASFYGYSPDELRRMNIDALNMLPPEQIAVELEHALAQQRNYFIFPHRLANGEVRTVEVHSTPIAVGDQQLLFSIIHDITARQQAEEALAASQALYRLLAENSSDAISLIDADGKVVYISPAYARRLGFDEGDLLNLDTPAILHLIHPDDRAAIAAEIKRGRELKLPTSRYEYRLRTKSGEYVWLEDVLRRDFDEQGQFLRTIVNSRIVTARKQAEQERDRLQVQLAEAQKMELVGRLAGGIAHEFNNMLAAIMLRTELLLSAAPAETPLQHGLTTIYSVSQRAAEMVRSLLGFARRQVTAPRVIDLNTAVEGALPLLKRLIGEEITIEWQPAATLWPVKIDPQQVEQILLNLCTNARDAISGVGTITLATAALTRPDATADVTADVTADATTDATAGVTATGGLTIPPGDYVMFAVSDTGIGMEPNVLAHIFEPFYTTKEVGAGSGLGLAAVEGIVRQNEGYIRVASTPGAGATFSIYLPRFTDPVAPVIQHRVSSLTYGHGETVLLVEDETVVAQMAIEALEFLGYTVMAASSPQAAIHQVESHAGAIDLLLTDIVMPEMNGGELAERIAALQPGVKRLFISGYPADFIAHRGRWGENVRFLQKPFTLEELAAGVHDALASVAPTPAG